MLVNINFYTVSGTISMPQEVDDLKSAALLYESLYKEWRARGERESSTIQMGLFGYEKTDIKGLSITGAGD